MTDSSEREKRKAHWGTRFSGWLVEKTPLAWTLAMQLVLTFSISFFLGTGFVAWRFGFNILVRFVSQPQSHWLDCLSTGLDVS